MPTSSQSMPRGTQFNPGHRVSLPYSWRKRLGQVGIQWPILTFNCFYFSLYMYIGGVGANPGNLPCTTCVRPGCKRYTVSGKLGRGVILNKNINKINRILSVLFHVRDVRDTLYEFNRLNSTHVRDIRDVLYCTFIGNCISHRSVDV